MKNLLQFIVNLYPGIYFYTYEQLREWSLFTAGGGARNQNLPPSIIVHYVLAPLRTCALKYYPPPPTTIQIYVR